MILVATLLSLSVALVDTVQTHQMRPVEVSETTRQRSLRSSAPQYALDANDLRVQGVVDMADALHRLPGITLRDYGGAGGMKTVSVRGFGAKHTGVSYDGLMLSDCQSGEIDVSRYSLDNVESLALTVGDGENIFLPARQATVPALLEIRTTQPPTADLRPHLRAQLKAGSFGYVSPFVRYAQSLSEHVAMEVQGTFTHADNHYPFTLRNVDLITEEKRTNNRMNSGQGEVSLVYAPSGRHSVMTKIYYYNNDRQLPGQVRYYTNVSREQLQEQTFFAQATYLGHLGHGLSVRAHAKWNWAMTDYSDPLYPAKAFDATYWQREAYGGGALCWLPSDHWALDYSVDYAFNNLNSSLVTDRLPRRHSIWQSIAVKYRTGGLSLTGRLLYSLLVNRSQLGTSSEDFQRLSPSLSAVWQLLPREELYLRASYKNIFRAPTFNENYFFHYGSPDLQPESTDQINVGMTWGHVFRSKTTLRLMADGYMNHVKDKILAIPHNMFIWRCINVGRVRVLGIDLTAEVRQELNKRHSLVFNGSYSLQRVEDRTREGSRSYNRQLAYMPQHLGSASLAWQNPWVNVTLSGQGVSHRYASNEHYDETRVAGYWETAITAWRQLQLGRGHLLELRADLRNLFDRQYEIVGHYPMPGRNFLFTINYKF